MSPKELWALRDSLNLSRVSLACFLGVAEITVLRWESIKGRSTPNGLELVVLRAIALAAAKAGHEEIGNLVENGLREQGKALCKLFSLAYGEPKVESA